MSFFLFICTGVTLLFLQVSFMSFIMREEEKIVTTNLR